MQLFGKMAASEYWICDNHTAQLGVVKTIYDRKEQPKKADVTGADENESGDESESQSGSESESENETESEPEEIQLNLNYQPTLKKMRKISGLFRRSSIKNEILQKYVKDNDREKGTQPREKRLLLDVCTRWGSLYDACLRFQQLLGPVRKALDHKEIKKANSWTDDDTERLNVSIYFISYLNILYLTFHIFNAGAS